MFIGAGLLRAACAVGDSRGCGLAGVWPGDSGAGGRGDGLAGLVAELVEQLARDLLERLAIVLAHLLAPPLDAVLLRRLLGERVNLVPVVLLELGALVGRCKLTRPLLAACGCALVVV